MSLSNCKRCGAVFSRVNQPLCPPCIREEDELLERASEWLRENPGRTIHAMSEATGIEKQLILGWARQRRIILAENIGILACKRCRETVPRGTLCDRCKLLLSYAVGEEIKAIKENAPPPEKEKQGMHYHREDRERKYRF